MYAFLFLPILVMAVFAFNKPSAAALAGFHGSNICGIPPAQIGNIPSGTASPRAGSAPACTIRPTSRRSSPACRSLPRPSLIATVLGLCAALALARMRPRLRAPFDSLVYLTLVVPEIVIAVASLIFFVQARKSSTAFPGSGNVTILIGQVVFNASLTMLIIRARFVGMGDMLEEAAYDLGSGPLATFRQVTLPRLAPAIVAAALLSFTFSFDDYVCPPSRTAPRTPGRSSCTRLSASASRPAVNALATIMLGATLAAVIVTALVLRRSRARVTAGQRATAGLGR